VRRPIPIDRLEGLDQPDRGLTAREVLERRERYGANDVLSAAPAGWRELIRDTLKDPMLWFLLGTSGLYGLIGEAREALVLLIAAIPFLGMDAYLHRRTQASTAGLSGQLAVQARVVRDGQDRTIPTAELVPGDLVEIAAGEAVPADAIFVSADAVQVDESALTGESYPVRKQPLATARLQRSAPPDDVHWGLAGTRVLTGRGRLRVAYTGADTLYGEIVRSALRGSHARTPLQSAIAQLVSVLVVAAAVLCIALAFIRWQQGHGLVDAVLSAITLAVAALPEEFPIVFTFFLGVGVYRLARRRALVRRAVVVENIGRVTTICTDKTGTLTEGRLHLAHTLPEPGIDEARLLWTAAAASPPDSQDPLDLAILAVTTAAPAERIAAFPFTEDRKRETAIVRREAGGRLVAVLKGAPETVFSMTTLDRDAGADWLSRVEAFAATSHKVIACAWRELDDDQWSGGEPDRGYRFAGLLAFEDPVRDGVADAVHACLEAGIHVIMVTGDHPVTAAAVGREVGLAAGNPVVVEADEIENAVRSDPRFLEGVDVIARAVPAQKLAFVRALQQQDEIVAVTGDGVNDVPALQAADVGIAMGERGTQSAREVAAIVLIDDNFSSIVHAIAEGQQLFSNLKLSFTYLLMIHLPLVLSAALIPLAGYPLLYLPIHIVWLELIIHPTALLVFQNLPGRNLLARQLPASRIRFFSAGEWMVIGSVGALTTALLVIGYDRSLGAGYDVEHARAMVIVALSAASAAITAALSGLETVTARVVTLLTMVFSVALVQTPALSAWLHVSPLHGDDWAIAVGGGVLVSLLPALNRLRWRRRRQAT